MPEPRVYSLLSAALVGLPMLAASPGLRIAMTRQGGWGLALGLGLLTPLLSMGVFELQLHLDTRCREPQHTGACMGLAFGELPFALGLLLLSAAASGVGALIRRGRVRRSGPDR